MKLSRFATIMLALMGLHVSMVHASVVVFSGSDAGATAPGSGSNGAAALFNTAAGLIGTASIINFESPLVATNNATNQTIPLATGVSVSGATIDIRNTLNCGADLCGSNTTAGGSQWLELSGGNATFTFATPIQFFGGYLGGLQGNLVGQEIITFTDGSSQTVNIPVLNGGFGFVGFTDVGASISSVTISAINDVISVDDVRYGPGATTTSPEPASLTLFGFGLGLVALSRRRLLNS